MTIRYKLMDKLEESSENIHDVNIFDPTSVDWNTFKYTSGYYPHKITSFEIMKPYLISYAYYGTVNYEDAILLVNKIENIWDVVPGTEIRVPKLQDIRTFVLENKK